MPTLTEGPFLQMAVFCESVLQEKEQTLSLIRVYGRLTKTAQGPGAPEDMPASMHALTLVLGWAAGAARGRHNVSVRSHAPSGLKLADSPALPVLFESEDRGVNVIMTVNLLVDQEGVYWFDVMLNEQVHTRIPLRVVYERVVTSS